LPASSAQ
jgi:hypothetical protein